MEVLRLVKDLIKGEMMKNSTYVLIGFVLITIINIFELKMHSDLIYGLMLACTYWIVKTLEDNKGN